MSDWSAYVERRWPDPPGPVSQLDLFADPEGIDDDKMRSLAAALLLSCVFHLCIFRLLCYILWKRGVKSSY